MNRRNPPMHGQRGAILIIALMFLLTITLLTLSSMRSSKIGLYLAQNEESRIAAEQAAQALADAIVSTPASTPVVGLTGYTACTPGESGCNKNDLPVTNPTLAYAVAANHMQARVERTGTTFRPPPRVVQTSIDKFSAASFRVTTTYDRIADGLGREQVTEGVLVLVPKQ
jgi:Tfp pilus assembly protein PilX